MQIVSKCQILFAEKKKLKKIKKIKILSAENFTQ